MTIASFEELENRASLVGLILGPLVFCIMFFLPAPEGLTPNGWKVLALSALMVIWWITEAIPLAATALLPIVLLPALSVFSVKQASVPFASPIIFFFIGGFLLAITIEKWGLHKRLALKIASMFSCNSGGIIAAFMTATAFISLWISNAATTMMMLPLAMAIVKGIIEWSSAIKFTEKEIRGFAAALLLSIAYAAGIGGIGTLVGTPANLVFRDYIGQSYGIDVEFARWAEFAMPLVIVLCIGGWWMLTKVFFPHCRVDTSNLRQVISEQKQMLPKMGCAEILTLVVFVVTVILWAFSGVISDNTGGRFNEATIALITGLALFSLPAGTSYKARLLEWKDAVKLPWGVIMLFGGSLSLSGALIDTGVSDWLGDYLTKLETYQLFMVVLFITLIVTFISEVISNIATVTAMLPIVAALSNDMGQNPLMLMIPTTMAASLAFMMPAGTPSNAIVFGSHFIRLRDMMKAGLAMNLISIIVVAIWTYYVAPLVFQFAK